MAGLFGDKLTSFFAKQEGPWRPSNRKRQEPDTPDESVPAKRSKVQKSTKRGRSKSPPVRAASPKRQSKRKTSKKHQKKDRSQSQSKNSKPLSNITFVITGEFNGITRERLSAILMDHGARVTGSVSKKTDYLVYGHVLQDGRSYTEGSKYKKAEQIGTATISEEEANEFLKEKVGYGFADKPQSPKFEREPPVVSVTGPRLTPLRTPVPDELSVQTRLWSDRYAPRNLQEIIIDDPTKNKAINWLKDWNDVHINGKKKVVKATRGGFNPMNNLNAKAMLLSGPPGIGKTTLARIITAGYSYTPIELNASDVRNKKAVSNIVKTATSNVAVLASGTLSKQLLIMDEVDGMSAGDRGGIQALIEIIKTTKIPIICIANDRQAQKIRSLVSHCFDVRLNPPSQNQILKRLLDISAIEGLEIDNKQLERIIEASGSDIRQCINIIEMQYKSSNNGEGNKKDQIVMLSNFDAASILLNEAKRKSYTQKQLIDLFFVDYDLIPLLIFEHYLAVYRTDQEAVDDIADAADAVAFGDLLNNKIRGGDWSLLPCMGQASTVHPTTKSKANVSFVKFPEWFGRNSTQTKNKRMLKEIRAWMALTVSGNDESLLTDYIPAIFQLLVGLLMEGNVEETVAAMSQYKINPTILKEHLTSLQLDPDAAEDVYKAIPTKVKTQLTKAYNALNKTSVSKVKKKKPPTKEEEKFDPDVEEKPEESSDDDSEEELQVSPIKSAPAAKKNAPKRNTSKTRGSRKK